MTLVAENRKINVAIVRGIPKFNYQSVKIYDIFGKSFNELYPNQRASAVCLNFGMHLIISHDPTTEINT